MSTKLLTLRTSPAQLARFARAAKAAQAKSRHAWALAVLEQAASHVPDEWLERRFLWVDQQSRRIPDEAGNPERRR